MTAKDTFVEIVFSKMTDNVYEPYANIHVQCSYFALVVYDYSGAPRASETQRSFWL